MQFDVHDPHYCHLPYSQEYHYSNDFTYNNIGCAALLFDEMWLKQTPNYLFYTTFFQDTRTVVQACSSNSIKCNASSPGVIIVGGACRCSETANYYAIK